MYVCQRERENVGEGACVCVKEGKFVSEGEGCVNVCARMRMCVCVCVCVRACVFILCQHSMHLIQSPSN